jgi:hypothetical protein
MPAFGAARRQGTLDKDFGELAVVRKQPHSGILRLVGFAAREQAFACHEVLTSHGEEREFISDAAHSPCGKARHFYRHRGENPERHGHNHR